jgi:hypothetical protein
MAAGPATAGASGKLADMAAGVGKTEFFDLAFGAFALPSGGAEGYFRWATSDGSLVLEGRVTCLRADGDLATVGGMITRSRGAEGLEGAGDPGRYLEFSVQDTPRFGADRASTLYLLGDSAEPIADCDEDHDLEQDFDPGFVSVYDGNG